ncbi:MAG: hypothetical protein F6J94_05175 [Moorea sp. SIO1F2]|uniref:hypothetical protein n=1 Tax=Moorena sp. SIO1F2 TaxID=2607819 RepID=UPI0013B9FAA0|nr:hypothetical protein [Moorena sp. SIO1F2]NEO48547.1 hypothetical protein [Moorena sp. SIO4A3]NET81365.1 hypothetical protein [Moorena sp. SIO1F2]
MALVILSATEIATLAFKKFLESGAGELAKHFTAAAIAKMDKLRKMVWDKLRNNPKAENALTLVEKGSSSDLERVADYLKVVMNEQPEFAKEIQAIAQEINSGKIHDNSSNTMNINDNGKGLQNNIDNIEGGTNYVAQEMHIHQGSD